MIERELTKKELKRREEIAKDLPDADFKKRYGADWMSVKMATATKMAKKEMKEAIGPKDASDDGEYNKEGQMMKNQLRQICSANEKLMSMVQDDDNLPEWVQSKVTKATDYIRSVRDYLEAESEQNEENMLTNLVVQKVLTKNKKPAPSDTSSVNASKMENIFTARRKAAELLQKKSQILKR